MDKSLAFLEQFKKHPLTKSAQAGRRHSVNGNDHSISLAMQPRTCFVIPLTNYSIQPQSVVMPTTHLIVIHSINGAHPNFDPVELAISVGDSVTWRNDDTGVHTASSTIDSPVFFDSEDIDPNGGEYTFTFNEAVESAPYECLYHQSMMKGTITVQ